MTMQDKAPQYLQKQKQRFYWDWWRENPREIVLVVFIIVLFILAPWQGCGISEQEIEPAEVTVVP